VTPQGPLRSDQTPATQWLREHGIAFTEHPYDYVEHGGTAESRAPARRGRARGGEDAAHAGRARAALVVLMHGDCQVSTKSLARAIGAKAVEPCRPEVAQRHSGYQVGGTSPFGLRKAPCRCTSSTACWRCRRIHINGGRRGYLVGIDPAVLAGALGAQPVACALPA
jgi:Cys-tRNA(Pro) deacylase